MHYLFEKVTFRDEPLLWSHRSISARHFSGFYHWHQCCEMLFVHEGNGSVIVNRKTHEIRRGMVFFFQPFQLHKVYANVSPEQPYIRSKIHFNPYDFEEKLRPFTILHSRYLQLWQGNHPLQAFDMGEAFEYVEQALAMHARQTLTLEGGREAEFEHALMLIIQMLNALSPLIGSHRPNAAPGIQPRPFTYAEKIMHWIEEHYMEDIKLDDIAEALHLSKFYLSRLFRNETGSSISQYLTARRIKIACRLLQTTDDSVERIGGEVGIPNPSYFIRLFKKVVGTTPLKYRQNN